MNVKLVQYLLNRLEVILIVIFLLFSEAVNVLPSLISLVKLLNYAFILIIIIAASKKLAYVITRDISLFILILITLSSIFWSVEPSTTSRFLIAFFRVTLFGVYLAGRFSLKEQMQILSWVAGLAVAINLVACILFPSYSIGVDPNNPSEVAWNGIYIFKQFLGRMMALTATVFLANLLNKQSNRWLDLIGFLASIALIQLSNSKTYLIAIAATILLLPLFKILKLRPLSRGITILLFMIIIGASGILIFLNLETIVVNVLGKDIQFNGRTIIWSYAIEKLLKQPYLGYGYAAFWESEFGANIARGTWVGRVDVDLKYFHAHNAFLDLTLQIGLIGITLLLLNITLVLKRVFSLISLTRTIESFWMLLLLTVQLIASMSEAPTYLSIYNIYWTLYVAIACSSALELNRIRRYYQLQSQQN
ncbi:MAG: O-antigen ligase family protein [Fischerella sp.]|nr:O-antigen ligase family protein [Fischerella sp.]